MANSRFEEVERFESHHNRKQKKNLLSATSLFAFRKSV